MDGESAICSMNSFTLTFQTQWSLSFKVIVWHAYSVFVEAFSLMSDNFFWLYECRLRASNLVADFRCRRCAYVLSTLVYKFCDGKWREILIGVVWNACVMADDWTDQFVSFIRNIEATEAHANCELPFLIRSKKNRSDERISSSKTT